MYHLNVQFQQEVCYTAIMCVKPLCQLQRAVVLVVSEGSASGQYGKSIRVVSEVSVDSEQCGQRLVLRRPALEGGHSEQGHHRHEDVIEVELAVVPESLPYNGLVDVSLFIHDVGAPERWSAYGHYDNYSHRVTTVMTHRGT